ncbi:MAG: T9SS type A sorting domain-containing protein [Candidatus Cloacimonetes bacterium]|nr:T9SS type A sorting domain-containing protein [Candidatus Cloacimonadota bacterium]
MKKLLVLAILVCAVALSATPTWTWHVQPTLLSFSMYDYQNGAYDGYPIRLQNEGIDNHGIYMTYMANQTAAVPRRQNYAFSSLDGTIQAEGTITSVPSSEGFGTLAIDPDTGNPIFVWHSGYGSETLSSYFTWDIFSFSNTAGNAFADYAPAIVNDPDEADHEYIWPVVHIGPSPTAGMKRIYVFASNSGSAVQTTPSSSVTLAFADFNADSIEMGMPSELVWTTQRIPYFLDIHNWSPSDPDDNFSRAFPSYAVSEDGKVALAGFIDGNTTEWSGMEEHDAFVVLSDNYGEDFTNIGLNLVRKIEEGAIPQADNNGETLIPYAFSDAEVSTLQMMTGTLNHKTITFDNFGKLHFPATFFLAYPTIDDPSTYTWFPTSHSVATVIFDPASGTHQFNNILPRPETPVTDILPMIYDLDEDGWIDNFVPVEDTDGTWYATEWFENQWPTFHHNTDNQFHYNQMRMSEFNEDGVGAMMWMDGTKAYMYNVNSDEDYAAYQEAPEIKIIVTRDNGMTWSEPITMNALADFQPELGTVPSYVYPADKVLTITEGTTTKARLYFMYVDDLSYGSNNQSEGANVGANIKFAAIDIDITDLPTENNDNVATVKPYGMLSQNYPNPFNPTTNIKFNIPAAGNVNLSIYNVKGQLVKTLANDNFTAGEHIITWNGNDNNNNSVASGVYFYKLDTNNKTEMKKMLLMK